MTEFFNALNKFKPKKRKPHTVTIDGKKIEVSHEKILEIQKSSINDWMLDDNNELVKKPVKKAGRKFAELVKENEGYTFIDNDPYWPNNISKEGYLWRIL